MAATIILLLTTCWLAAAQFRPDHNILTHLPDAEESHFRYTFVVELRHSMTVADGRLERSVMFDDSDSQLKYVGRQMDSNSSDCARKIPLEAGKEAKVPVADGLPRQLLLVNGMLPGPTILVNLHATVEVKVINRVPNEVVSIHWHGQTQNGTAWMDGTSSVAQCQILPGQTFVYRFQADNSGTHWWRAYLSSQISAGLYGPMIVVDPKVDADEKFDAEYITILQDLFLDSESNFSHLNRGTCDYTARSLDGSELGTEEFPSVIVNGRGWYNSPKCSQFVAKPWQFPVEKFPVAPGGKRYLFRLIGANTVYPLKISIDYHSLHVIATDGNPIVKVTVDQLIVNAGERYDFYITTNNDNPGNQNFYPMRVATTQAYAGGTVERRAEVETTVGIALLQYNAGELPPTPTVSTERDCLKRPCTILNCPYKLTETVSKAKGWTCVNVDQLRNEEPVIVEGHSGDQFKLVEVEFKVSQSEFGVRRSTVDGYNFMLPFSPPGQSGSKLASEMKICQPKCRNRPHCECSYHVTVDEDQLVVLVISNRGGADGISFPFHLHGHQFEVLKVGWPQYNEETNILETPVTYDASGVVEASRPVLKDTVIVPVGGYVLLRFVADNAGWWMAQTILKDLQDQFSFLINVGEVHPSPPPEFPRCPPFYNRPVVDGTNDTAGSHHSHEHQSSEEEADHHESGKHGDTAATDGSDDSSSEEQDGTAQLGSQLPQHPSGNKAGKLPRLSATVAYLTLLLSQSLVICFTLTLSL